MPNHTALGNIAVGAPGSQARFENNLNEFMRIYTLELAECVRTMPIEYAYGVEMVPTVAERMRNAIVKRSYNIHSPAFKRTCKAFGIKPTYKAVAEALEYPIEEHAEAKAGAQ